MKKKQIGTLLLLLFVISSFVQCDTAQKKELKPQLDSYFTQQINKLSGVSDVSTQPGLSVIITQKDSILYKGNFGSADLDKHIPITENTIFDIASASKQFTGMAIALLEEKGKINVNDPIHEYLPDLPEVMKEITIDQLLHHSSGIRDWPMLFALKGWQPQSALSLDKIYEMLQKQESLNFIPGTEFSYSNSNYNLLAKIVEKITGTRFEKWTHDQLFVPLGMEHTYYKEAKNSKQEEIANSYVYTGKNYLPFISHLNAPGSSSLRSNTSDLSKWLIHFYHKNLEKDAVFLKMTHKGKLNSKKPIDYGYGLRLNKIKNRKAYAHAGTWGGYRSGTIYFPEENTGIVILSNNGMLNPPKMVNDILDIIYEKDEKQKVNENNTPERKINDDFFALCAGKYIQVDDQSCCLTFFKRGDEYFANVYGKDFKLYAKSDSVLFVKEAKAELVFHLKNGKVDSHTLHQNGNSYLALKVKEKNNKIQMDCKQFIGNYYSKELDLTFEIKSENNELKVHSSGFPRGILLEYSEDLTFTSKSGLLQSVSFLKENGKITNLCINNPRVKNLSFTRVSG